MPDVSQHPWALWVAAVAFILPAIASIFPKVLGPLGQAWSDWTRRQRTAATETDDHDIAEMKRAMENMGKMLSEERHQNASYRALIADLYRYILEAQRDPQRLNETVPDPANYLAQKDG